MPRYVLSACARPQADISRDRNATYWETSRKATHSGFAPDSLWYRDAMRGDVRAMVRGVR